MPPPPTFPRFAIVPLLFATGLFAADVSITVDIDPESDRTPISPYVYGTNQDIAGAPVTARRMGGNRITGYNWENNASNAGSDWYHSSDSFMTNGIPRDQANVPGISITDFHDRGLAAGVGYSIVTLPMAGYVARDKNGTVSAAEAAPSPRWAEVRNTKDGPLLASPDVSDGYVYTDELLRLLVDRYGPASSPRGIRAYAFDNEPDLWSHTHARLHPSQPTCVELLSRSIDLARTVKRIDPTAETFGFVSYGFSGYYSFQGAPDWATEQAKGAGRYRWFVDYFLDRMRQASTAEGRRLLDVLDLHNYSEHAAGGIRVSETTDYTNIECNKGRLQAPRGLWDPTFVENSWIGQWFSSFLPLLPNVRASMDAFYPGTKLAFTEYNAGGEGHISGGIAQADYLGIFGRYGVYAANLWQLHTDAAYSAAAFRLYRNYDGAGGTFGDLSVPARVSDNAIASAHAALDSRDESKLHLILLNKNYDGATTVAGTIAGPRTYSSARWFAFDSTGPAISERPRITSLAGNRFSVTLPALTAAHLVLESTERAPAIAAQPRSLGATSGNAVAFAVEATGTAPLAYQWYRGGVALPGATSATLTLPTAGPADAGLYDVAVSGVDRTLSQPAVLGIVPPAGQRTAGSVTTRDEWQNIHHANGATYDQFLLTGAAGTFTADPGQIARCSYLDENDSIVQVEMSGAGAITINLDTPSGPMAPALYNQSGIQYMKGKATIILVGADQTTHFTIYSVGTATNPGVTRPDAAYAGWADIAVAGILSTNGGLGGIHQGNANYNATVGYTGLYAPNTTSVGGLVVVHGIAASGTAQPYLFFGPGGTAAIKIAGTSLAQPNGDAITVQGLAKVTMGAGQDSCGRAAPAQQIATRLLDPAGTDVTPQIVEEPSP